MFARRMGVLGLLVASAMAQAQGNLVPQNWPKEDYNGSVFGPSHVSRAAATMTISVDNLFNPSTPLARDAMAEIASGPALSGFVVETFLYMPPATGNPTQVAPGGVYPAGDVSLNLWRSFLVTNAVGWSSVQLRNTALDVITTNLARAKAQARHHLQAGDIIGVDPTNEFDTKGKCVYDGYPNRNYAFNALGALIGGTAPGIGPGNAKLALCGWDAPGYTFANPPPIPPTLSQEEYIALSDFMTFFKDPSGRVQAVVRWAYRSDLIIFNGAPGNPNSFTFSSVPSTALIYLATDLDPSGWNFALDKLAHARP